LEHVFGRYDLSAEARHWHVGRVASLTPRADLANVASSDELGTLPIRLPRFGWRGGIPPLNIPFKWKPQVACVIRSAQEQTPPNRVAFNRIETHRVSPMALQCHVEPKIREELKIAVKLFVSADRVTGFGFFVLISMVGAYCLICTEDKFVLIVILNL